MKLVVDASAIIEGFIPPGDCEVIIPSSVEDEIKNKGMDFLVYRVLSPRECFVEKVREAARKTGDLDVLSKADIDVISLALQENATLISDDYAIQNVASVLGIHWEEIHQQGIKEVRKWRWRCESCGRYFSKYYPQCPVCGGKLRRVKSK